MTIIYAAATVYVNPPGETPVLSLEQLWKGLELKVRKPQLFIPVIESCKVLSDENESVEREVLFKAGPVTTIIHLMDLIAHIAPGGPTSDPVVETITHLAPVGSEAKSGVETFAMKGSQSKVLNIVSEGPEGELMLTFTFEWEHKDIEKGSEQEKEKQKGYQSTAPKAAAGTVRAIREMIQKGEL
ncbi:DUF1857 domain containing protein [Rutstroemia sp. NJR-2017a BBW]|nr:DUF1857 domain containing protein [Rutstroemia sp. NJR-2017a BBW]